MKKKEKNQNREINDSNNVSWLVYRGIGNISFQLVFFLC